MQGNGSRQNGQIDGDLQKSVIAALEDEQYDWRTVEGLAGQTGIPAEKIQEILKSVKSEVVRSAIPDELGRALYTTRKHSRTRVPISGGTGRQSRVNFWDHRFTAFLFGFFGGLAVNLFPPSPNLSIS